MNLLKKTPIIGTIALAFSISSAQTEQDPAQTNVPASQPAAAAQPVTAPVVAVQPAAVAQPVTIVQPAAATQPAAAPVQAVNVQTKPQVQNKAVPVYYIKQTPPTPQTTYKVVAAPAKQEPIVQPQTATTTAMETKATTNTASTISNDSLNVLRHRNVLEQHVGIQGSIGSTTFSGSDNTPDFENGLIWSAGLFYQFPLTKHILYFELGANVISRTVEHTQKVRENAYRDKISSYNLAFPLLFNAKAGFTPLNFSMGAQIETPLYNHHQSFINGNEAADTDLKKNSCKYISWDFVFGLGVSANKHFGLDARVNYGISDIYNGFYNDGAYWSFTPVDFSISAKITY